MDRPDNLIERYVGDDWVFGPLPLTTGEGADERAADLSGCSVSALLYLPDNTPGGAGPRPYLEGDHVTVATDRTTGVIEEVWIPKADTKFVQPGRREAPRYDTRADIVVTDSRGRDRTWTIVFVLPLSRAYDVPPSSGGGA